MVFDSERPFRYGLSAQIAALSRLFNDNPEKERSLVRTDEPSFPAKAP
jgi:hypothetical protein